MRCSCAVIPVCMLPPPPPNPFPEPLRHDLPHTVHPVYDSDCDHRAGVAKRGHPGQAPGGGRDMLPSRPHSARHRVPCPNIFADILLHMHRHWTFRLGSESHLPTGPAHAIRNCRHGSLAACFCAAHHQLVCRKLRTMRTRSVFKLYGTLCCSGARWSTTGSRWNSSRRPPSEPGKSLLH